MDKEFISQWEEYLKLEKNQALNKNWENFSKRFWEKILIEVFTNWVINAPKKDKIEHYWYNDTYYKNYLNNVEKALLSILNDKYSKHIPHWISFKENTFFQKKTKWNLRSLFNTYLGFFNYYEEQRKQKIQAEKQQGKKIKRWSVKEQWDKKEEFIQTEDWKWRISNEDAKNLTIIGWEILPPWYRYSSKIDN